MTQIKKFGLGAFATALFAVMAFATLANTAYADVSTLTRGDATIAPNGTTTLTATLNAEPADGDTVEFVIQGDSSADGGLGDDEDDQFVVCVIDSDAGNTDDGNCDDGTAEVETTNGLVAFTVTLTADAQSDEGTLNVEAEHDGVGQEVTVFVEGDADDELDSVSVRANPTSIPADSTTTESVVTATVNDDIAGETITFITNRGFFDTDGAGNCDDDGTFASGERTCEATTDGDGDAVAHLYGDDDPPGSATITVLADTFSDTTDVTLTGAAGTIEAGGNIVTEDDSAVELEFVVTDQAGDPVTGLAAGDFDVTVSGEVESGTDWDGTITEDDPGEYQFQFTVADDEPVGTVINVSVTTEDEDGDDLAEAEATITIVGAAATVTVAVGDVVTGGTGTVTVTAVDAQGNPVEDGTAVAVGASAGSVIGCTDGSETDDNNGTVTCTFVAPTNAQTVLVTAVVDGESGSATVNVGGTAPPAEGDGNLSTPTFGSGNVGAAVFSGGTIAELAAEVTAAGGTSVWAQTAAGTWVRYNTLATGATAFVNNAFNEAFAAGFDGPTAVFVVK